MLNLVAMKSILSHAVCKNDCHAPIRIFYMTSTTW